MQNPDLGREVLEALEQYEKETSDTSLNVDTRKPLEANQAAREFLKSHHSKAQFKQHPLYTKKEEEIILPSEGLRRIEQSMTSTALKIRAASIKQSFKRTFTGAIFTDINHKAVSRIRLPSLQARIISSTIDLFSCLILTALLSSVYVLSFEPAFRTQLLIPDRWDNADWLFFSGIIFGMFLVSVILYPLVTYIFMGKTIGQIVSNTKVIRYGQLTSTKGDLILRTINLPLSAICLGFMPLFFHRRTLHDFVSGTAVTKD